MLCLTMNGIVSVKGAVRMLQGGGRAMLDLQLKNDPVINPKEDDSIPDIRKPCASMWRSLDMSFWQREWLFIRFVGR